MLAVDCRAVDETLLSPLCTCVTCREQLFQRHYNTIGNIPLFLEGYLSGKRQGRVVASAMHPQISSGDWDGDIQGLHDCRTDTKLTCVSVVSAGEPPNFGGAAGANRGGGAPRGAPLLVGCEGVAAAAIGGAAAAACFAASCIMPGV